MTKYNDTTQSAALGNAIVAGNHRKVRALLAGGTSPDCVVWGWDTALFMAVRLRRVLIAETLLAAGAVPKPGPSGRSPLVSAAESGNPELLLLLLRRGALVEQVPTEPDGFTPIEIAVLANFGHLVAPLAAAGADPNHRMKQCFARTKWPGLPQNQSIANALYLARTDRTPLGRKIRVNSASRLIEHTPILLASIACGAHQVTEALVKIGARLDLKDSEGAALRDYQCLRRRSLAASRR
jgi:ankyrin repeat protein